MLDSQSRALQLFHLPLCHDREEYKAKLPCLNHFFFFFFCLNHFFKQILNPVVILMTYFYPLVSHSFNVFDQLFPSTDNVFGKATTNMKTNHLCPHETTSIKIKIKKESRYNIVRCSGILEKEKRIWGSLESLHSGERPQNDPWRIYRRLSGKLEREFQVVEQVQGRQKQNHSTFNHKVILILITD